MKKSIYKMIFVSFLVSMMIAGTSASGDAFGIISSPSSPTNASIGAIISVPSATNPSLPGTSGGIIVTPPNNPPQIIFNGQLRMLAFQGALTTSYTSFRRGPVFTVTLTNKSEPVVTMVTLQALSGGTWVNVGGSREISRHANTATLEGFGTSFPNQPRGYRILLRSGGARDVTAHAQVSVMYR